jgi:hypothetical protein
MSGGAPSTRLQAWTGKIMDELQSFQAAARESGFIAANDSSDHSTLWLKRAAADPSKGAPQRMCLDTVTKSATVYWTNARGLTDSKTFRTADLLREWLSATLVPR